MTGADPLLLPERTILLHVGPPKTASTAVQAAMYGARNRLLTQGVRHAGRSRHPAVAIHAATGRKSALTGGVVPPAARWRDLVREATSARERRVVISSEFLADGDAAAIGRIVGDLGPDRVHVVVTLRPLARVLVSQWQQYVQDGIRASFQSWLEAVLAEERPAVSPLFWHRHRHDRLVARWAGVVGADRVTVIVLEEGAPDQVLRVFERLTGLREGTLRLSPDRTNRSLTLPEVEAVRAFNEAFLDAGLPRPLLSQVIHTGAGRLLKRLEPDPDAPRIELPAWALDPVAHLAAEIVDGISAAGVRVVGDLDSLAWVPDAGPARGDLPVEVPPDVAGRLAMAVLGASGRSRRAASGGDLQAAARAVPARAIAGVLARRGRAAIRSRLDQRPRDEEAADDGGDPGAWAEPDDSHAASPHHGPPADPDPARRRRYRRAEPVEDHDRTRMNPPTTQADLLLPEGARLLHIGPHKTGTTSLQAAMWAARDAMREQGVRLASHARNPADAVRAVTGQASAYSEDTAPPIRLWRGLVRDITAAGEPRVVVSSEFFALASPEVIRRIAADLDPARLHVAVTVRPLARILPSMWQQNVQAGTVASLDRWLERLFDTRPEAKVPPFWTLHRHDRLVARWADVLGPDRLTVVVVDDRDHSVVLRAFEALLGLREGTLSQDRDMANRSLTLPETEAVRAFNRAFKDERLGRALHARVMRFGAAQQMKLRQPGADEPPVELPQWALDRAAEVGAEIVAGLRGSGVRIVGDLDALSVVEQSRLAGDRVPPVSIPPEVAAAMAMGVLVSTGATRDRGAGARALSLGEPVELVRVPTRQVAGVLARRLGLAALDRLAALRRRIR